MGQDPSSQPVRHIATSASGHGEAKSQRPEGHRGLWQCRFLHRSIVALHAVVDLEDMNSLCVLTFPRMPVQTSAKPSTPTNIYLVFRHLLVLRSASSLPRDCILKSSGNSCFPSLGELRARVGGQPAASGNYPAPQRIPLEQSISRDIRRLLVDIFDLMADKLPGGLRSLLNVKVIA